MRVESRVFGPLELRHGDLEGSVHVPPDSTVSVEVVDVGVEGLRAAEAWLPPLPELFERGAAYACEQLLDTKNSAWVESKDEEVTAEVFIATLSPISVELSTRGVELGYCDHELFWGHLVVVQMNPDGSFRHATLAG